MSGLWQPPGSRQTPVGLPVGDKALSDGRWLRCKGPVEAKGLIMVKWQGPRFLRVLASLDDTPYYGPLLHVSLSYPDRDPPWRDIRLVRDAFYPASVDCMMVLPRSEDYVNYHPHAFHIWQTPLVWGIR